MLMSARRTEQSPPLMCAIIGTPSLLDAPRGFRSYPRHWIITPDRLDLFVPQHLLERVSYEGRSHGLIPNRCKFSVRQRGPGQSMVSQVAGHQYRKATRGHRKNTAALTSANQVAFDGLRSLMERHGNLLKTSVDEYTKVTSDVLAAGSFEESATKQADAARYGYDSTVARLRELGDIATRANVAALDILNPRITEPFDELKALFAAPVGPSAAPPPVIA